MNEEQRELYGRRRRRRRRKKRRKKKRRSIKEHKEKTNQREQTR